jgi:hypothetical protein
MSRDGGRTYVAQGFRMPTLVYAKRTVLDQLLDYYWRGVTCECP